MTGAWLFKRLMSDWSYIKALNVSLVLLVVANLLVSLPQQQAFSLRRTFTPKATSWGPGRRSQERSCAQTAA